MDDAVESNAPKDTEIAWKAESLRFTAFPTITGLDVSNLWSLLEKGPADQIVQQPALQLSQATGKTKLGGQEVQLSLQAAADRVHWLVNPIGLYGPDARGLLVVGPFSTALRDFFAIVLDLLKNPLFPPTKRIAFGAVLLNSVPDLKEGYRQLGRLLRDVEVDAENSNEFFFQINRPRLIKTDFGEFRINRMSKWSVARLLQFSVQVSDQNISASAGAFGAFATRLEIDISGDSNRTDVLRPDFLASLFPRLIEYGIEISEHGDIR